MVTSTSPHPALMESALQELADIFGDGMTASHLGGHLTCTEADAIARAVGLVDREAARTLLDGHAYEDEDGDDADHVARRDQLIREERERFEQFCAENQRKH